jgi:TRAP transporter 4TM/12TM fusion protein
MAEARDTSGGTGLTRFGAISKPVRILYLIAVTCGIGLFMFYMFGWNVNGFVFSSTQYYYLLFVLFGFGVYITLPMRKKDRGRVPWHDYVLGFIASTIPIYAFLNAGSIDLVGWTPPTSTLAIVLGTIWGLVALEGGRRIGGWPFLTIQGLAWIYPLIADHMPGVLYGISFNFPWTVGNFAFSHNGVLGLPGQVLGEILIGFLLFAGMLMASGAGKFFLDLSLGLLGKYRGGPAKVAVLSSGFFGSLSGSSISNVVATGSVTIPTMKRIGYPPHYAGAIEACASTGGTIMPPVMGVVAFIMATITQIEYAAIVSAAFIPALLYYFGLMMQVDAYAGRVGLRGLPKEEIPPLLKTLKSGWPYITVLAFLIFGLLYMRWSVLTPIYASGLMFILSFTNKETMMTPRRIVRTLSTVGPLITQMFAIMTPVGFVLGGLIMTGVAGAFTTELVALSGGNLLPVLLMGVAICYIMGLFGMGGLAYIFLAVTLAPALIKIGDLNRLAVHFFIAYYGVLGFITPPIGVVGWVGAAIAGAPPMKTLMTSMRLGVVLLFIPFFFLFSPSLILEGTVRETIYLFILCIIGIGVLAGGLEGYLLKVGRLTMWSRVLLVIGGFLIAFPGVESFNWWMTSVTGFALTALVIFIIILKRKFVEAKPATVDVRVD